MRYLSTRGRSPEVSFAEALLRGMALDGGLYLPAAWPQLPKGWFADAASRPYSDIVAEILGLFAGGSISDGAIRAAARRLDESFTHAAIAPLSELEPGLWMLELFHGPTSAFKDLAMQLMATLTDAALADRGERLLLLTATSGDTGAAAVRAFEGAARTSLVVFHPLGRVSPVQRRQMVTTDAPNILNIAVEGDFDDCQAIVKALLADETLREGARLSSVNSINWGRLVGQIPYYLASCAALASEARPATFVVPTGNFGDAFAGYAAQKIGAPMGPLVAAVNANDALARAVNEGRYQRRPANPTASVSMDVQAPSNFERLVFEASSRDGAATAELFSRFAREGGVDLPAKLLAAIRAEVSAVSFDDTRTAAEIVHAWSAYGRVICPHTAVALGAARGVDRSRGPVIALSTAHAAKFPEFVGQALGRDPEPPPAMRRLEGRPERLEILPADVASARERVGRFQAAALAPA